MVNRTLADACEIVMGQSPAGEMCNAAGIGLPLLNGPTEYGDHHPTPVQFTTDARKRAKAGDLLFCVRGSTTGRMNWADRDYAIGRGVAAIRHKSQYELQPLVRAVIEYQLPNLLIQATGSTFPNVSSGQLSSLPWPNLDERHQRSIAQILGTLDDKIELNRRMNETLEAMARALFKAWFVDFEPVRAKIEGRWQRGQSVPGLPAHLYDLFPERLVESELGEIPEGWRNSTIGEEVTVRGGSTPSTKESEFWEAGQHCWATPKDLSTLKVPVLLDTDRKITDAGLAKISSGLLPVGTVLLSSRAPIGYLAIAEVPTAINQGFIAMKCDGSLPNVFVLFWCRENMDLILGNANGSTFQEISKSNFRPIPVIVPPDSILDAFRARTELLYRHIVENERESKNLALSRDILLPKLISGELRINPLLDISNEDKPS